LLLQFSFVQTIIAKKAASVLSEKLHTEVTIGKVDVSMFLDIVLEDVEVKDLHHKTFLDSKAIVLDLNDLFLNRNVISINDIVLKDLNLNIIKYKNEKTFNFQFIVDYFKSNDTTKSGKSWKINIGSVKLINTNFKFIDQNNVPQKGITDFNDLELSGINTQIVNLAIINDYIYADIRSLSMKEKSGFYLKSFSAITKISPLGIDMKNLHIETPGSSISANFSLAMKSFDDFNDIINKVKIDVLFKPSKIDVRDFAYFSKSLEGMNDKINISGEIKGKVSNFKGKDFRFLYGTSTYFLGDFSISGLPKIEDTYIQFNVKNFYTSQYDLETFTLPTSSGAGRIELPPELIRLGSVRFKGEFTGFYNDFVASGNFTTGQGSVTTDLTLRKNHNSGQIEYIGKVASSDFNIGNILSMQDQIGSVSMNADVSGSGLDFENAVLKVKGTIASIYLRNYHYQNINVEGDLAKKKFSGFLSINDENLKLDLNGKLDFSNKLPVINVTANIENLRATKLHFFKLDGDSISSFSTKLALNFRGNTIDNIQGLILASNTSYIYRGEKYTLDNLAFSNVVSADGEKTMKLRSDYIDADFSGNFLFKNLNLSVLKFIKDYLPSYGRWIKKDLDTLPEENFTYNVKLKNTTPLTKLLMPDLSVSANTIISGTYNTRQSLLDLNITSALTRYKKISVKDFFVSGRTKQHTISLNIGCAKLIENDSLDINDITLLAEARNDSVDYKLTWNNNKDEIKNSGEVDGFVSMVNRPRTEIKFTKADVVINDTAWTINGGNDIMIDSSSIAIQKLIFFTEKQQIEINGKISNDPTDKLHLGFKDFNVGDVKMFTSLSGFDIDGFLNGSVEVSNIYKSPNVVADITLNNLFVNGEKLGKASLVSSWDDQSKTATINAQIIYEGNIGSNIPIAVAGSYYPEKKKDNFDLDVSMTNFKLKLLERFISSFSSNLSGLASGKLKLRGTPKEPELTGGLYVMVKNLKIDYLNENYHFTDSIRVNKNAFAFNHILIKDDRNDSAILDGSISHRNFKDIKLDLNFHVYDFRCLNTDEAQNSMFYGKAFVTGLLKISGDVNNIKINIAAQTNKNTSISIPISSESDITANNYIRFVNSKTPVHRASLVYTDLSGIELDFNLSVTPDAAIQIILDSKTGDIIKAKGSGNIQLEISTLGDFSMYGDYIIDEGDYLFTLQNVINKKFLIEKGSSISWNGDPYEGIADITAIYPVKAALYDLTAAIGDTTAQYKKRIPVNCLLNMKDKILNPTISFNIDLPKSDESTKTLVSGLINTDEEMNKQVFSLLILNRFTNPKGLTTADLNSGLGSTSSELLSNQLDNWLAQISKKFDIGVNYRPGNEISAQQVEFALGTQLFNDRLSIQSNLGVSGNNNAGGQASTTKTSDIVGDVDMEYKITNDGHLLLKGYNKSNTVDLLNSNAPYTQGIGVFYRREFDKWGDLFKKKKKK